MGELIRNITMAGAVLSAGVASGYMVEGHTNEVARGKIITVDTCMETSAYETSVTKGLKKCFKDGVPGGNVIGDDKFVGAYRNALQNEQESIETPRLAMWSVGAPAGAIAVGAFFVTVFG